MFFKRIVEPPSTGRLYIIRLVLDDQDIIHKIGMTHSPRSADRMMEILRSWFMKYRYIPNARLKLDFETGVPLLFEQHMHDVLKDWKWVPDKKVDGAQEMFKDLDEEEVIRYIKNFDYTVLLKGKSSMRTKDYDYICSIPDKNFNPDEDLPF